MSRKSKRRRKGSDPEPTSAPVESAAFEFVDDRTAGATAADFVVQGGAAPSASEPADAASRAVPSASAGVTAHAANAPAAAAVRVEPPAVPQKTLGEVLASAREARGLSLEEASARTRISIPTLRNLEGDRFEEMVAAAYARGFLRNYGSFLRLDVKKLLQQYDAVVGKHVETAPESWEHAAGNPERTTPRWAAWVAVAMGIAVAAGGVVVGVRNRQGVPLGTGAGLRQIEEELRASQAPPPEPANSVVANPTPTSAEANPAATTPAPGTVAPVPEPLETGKRVALPVEDTTAPVLNPATPPPVGSLVGPTVPARSGIASEVRPSVPVPGTSVDLARAPAAVQETVPSATGDLLLTVTARDTCALRLQIDADARHAQRYHFAQPGESRTWSARRSFRLLVQRGQHLEVRLNGKLIAVPEGRTLVLDRTALAPGARPARRKKSRPASVAKTPPPPPAAANATALTPTVPPPHAAGPPPL